MSFASPFYRYLALMFDFDEYSSKGSAVHPAKKFSRRVTAFSRMFSQESVPAIQGVSGADSKYAQVEATPHLKMIMF